MTVPHPRAHAAAHPDKPALIIADTGESISYAQLIERADRAAQLFASLGLVEGDTLALLLENHVRYPELIWAAKNSGITYVCISSQSSVDDAAYIVDNCDAKLLVSSARLADVARPLAQRLGDRLQYLMVDGEAAPHFPSYEALLERETPVAPQGRRRGPSMLYSSGTTGRPKGVRATTPVEPPEVPPRRHGLLVQQYGYDADTVLINPGPMYHAGPGRFMVCVLRCGGTVVSLRKFDAPAVLQAIETHRATHGLFVPTMFIRMLRLDDAQRTRHDLSRLRCVVHLGAPCPIPVKEKMIEWLGPVIDEMYAGTESIGHTFIGSRDWLAHKGSVGKPPAGCRIRIVDENDNDQPTGVPGLIRLHNGNRFAYHKDEEKTRGAIDAQGWGTFGDVGYLDDEGYLYLTDRQSHMIISGGVNIYPQEAENLLATHPGVTDVAVIGVPHAEFGEEVKAVVQPRVFPVPHPEIFAAELIAYCRWRLTALKCPRTVDFVETLPRSESGKLLKRLVKEPYWAGRSSLIQ